MQDIINIICAQSNNRAILNFLSITRSHRELLPSVITQIFFKNNSRLIVNPENYDLNWKFLYKAANLNGLKNDILNLSDSDKLLPIISSMFADNAVGVLAVISGYYNLCLENSITLKSIKLFEFYMDHVEFIRRSKLDCLLVHATRKNTKNLEIVARYDILCTSYAIETALTFAIENKLSDAIQILLNLKNIFHIDWEKFIELAIENNFAIEDLLLKCPEHLIQDICKKVAEDELKEKRYDVINKLPSNKIPKEALIAAIHTQDNQTVKNILNEFPMKSETIGNSLCIAAKKGYKNIIKLLLKTKKCDFTWNDNIPLVMAAKYGHIDCVCELLNHANDRNPELYERATLLAVKYGHEDILKVLFKAAYFSDSFHYKLHLEAKKRDQKNMLKFLQGF